MVIKIHPQDKMLELRPSIELNSIGFLQKKTEF